MIAKYRGEIFQKPIDNFREVEYTAIVVTADGNGGEADDILPHS